MVDIGIACLSINSLIVVLVISQYASLFLYPTDINLHVLNDNDYTNLFTIVVPSYDKRVQLLKGLLDYINNKVPTRLLDVIVVWNSKLVPNITTSNYKFPISFYYPEDKSVVSRFMPEIRANCFLSFDDDLRMPADILDRGHMDWSNHQDQIVGYTRRSFQHTPNGTRYKAYGEKIYSMVLTGMSFFHKKFASEFYQISHNKSLQYVSSKNNCEDILMNFVVSNITKKPPVYLNHAYLHVSKSGISSKPGHVAARGKCIDEFEKDFGIELNTTSLVLV